MGGLVSQAFTCCSGKFAYFVLELGCGVARIGPELNG